jgi:hypothetical protein
MEEGVGVVVGDEETNEAEIEIVAFEAVVKSGTSISTCCMFGDGRC